MSSLAPAATSGTVQYSTADIRNVLMCGHGGSGKTTLIDTMLFSSGTVTRKGSVADGSSFGDFEKEEKEHKHSISTKVLHVDHQGKRINLIDAPGSPDLIGAGLACLPAVETVAVVIDATAGIGVVTRRMMEAARQRDLPRAIIINKIEAVPVPQLKALVDRVRETFGSECLPINLPADGGKAVVECLLNSQGKSDLGDVAAAHTAILEQIVELDERLMEKYLGGEEPDYSALHEPFERAMDSAHVVPICFADGRSGVGVPELLDAIARHFPSPLEGNPRPFVIGGNGGSNGRAAEHANGAAGAAATAANGGVEAAQNGSTQSFAYVNDANRPLLAHLFKVTSDPFSGKLAIFRVHQGKCSGHSQVLIGTNKKTVKLAHVFHLQGKEHREVPHIVAGDIGAVAKVEEIHSGDVLHDDHALDNVHIVPEQFPSPMFGLAITPKARGDEQKISALLSKLTEEDPTFRWHTDRQTHEVVINGLGELHLRLVLERLKNRGLDVDTKPPKIAYRETITAKGEGHHRHKKQTGGAGQFGEVFLYVEPLERGKGFEFVDETFGGSIPNQFIPAIEKGIRETLEGGVIAGYPVQDVRVVVTDGKHHPVDSKEIAFKTAGRMAFKQAFAAARPSVLEPIVNVEVTVPEDKVGAINGDLSGKRGRIQGADILTGGMAQIKAQAPLAELMMYQSQLKSMTGGQGAFSMELAHYEAVPPQVQQALIAQFHPRVEEE
jgi:elongation factor G